MMRQVFLAIVLLASCISVSYQITASGLPCDYEDTAALSDVEADDLNIAIESAVLSFEKNPVYSSANHEFFSAMSSFPASVNTSLECYGYTGININSLPTWLTSVPTSVVSIVLKEQQFYQSIIASFNSEVGATPRLYSFTSQPTTTSNSPHITTSGVSTSVSSTSLPTSTSSSLAAISTVSGTLTSSFLVAVGLMFTAIL